MPDKSDAGPLSGLRVVEFASIGPGPHCAMLLGDLGADVIRIDRDGGNGWPNPVVDRGRALVTLNIKTDAGRLRCLELADLADVLIEGFRPGVMERLGLGPDVVLTRNPRLVYGRMTGWGQTGPLAQAAGHDINYIALTGALAAMGEPGEPPIPPLNLVGDFGGGSVYLAFGIMAALWERQHSGRGQVVDAAIIDGVASMMTMFAGLLPSGRISVKREENLLAGAAPFYRCYRCSDDEYISIGSLEPQFYSELLSRIGVYDEFRADQNDRANWQQRADALAALFKTRPAAHWRELLEGTDACFAPVLELTDAPNHPHNRARQSHVIHDGVLQAAPAPRFSRSASALRPACNADEVLAAWKKADQENRRTSQSRE
jgi:alpha-methylacyl-CoA racemase